MEKRKARVIFHKSWNVKSAKITIPIPLLREMEVTEEKREVELIFDKENKKIEIK